MFIMQTVFCCEEMRKAIIFNRMSISATCGTIIDQSLGGIPKPLNACPFCGENIHVAIGYSANTLNDSAVMFLPAKSFNAAGKEERKQWHEDLKEAAQKARKDEFLIQLKLSSMWPSAFFKAFLRDCGLDVITFNPENREHFDAICKNLTLHDSEMRRLNIAPETNNCKCYICAFTRRMAFFITLQAHELLVDDNETSSGFSATVESAGKKRSN